MVIDSLGAYRVTCACAYSAYSAPLFPAVSVSPIVFVPVSSAATCMFVPSR